MDAESRAGCFAGNSFHLQKHWCNMQERPDRNRRKEIGLFILS